MFDQLESHPKTGKELFVEWFLYEAQHIMENMNEGHTYRNHKLVVAEEFIHLLSPTGMVLKSLHIQTALTNDTHPARDVARIFFNS